MKFAGREHQQQLFTHGLGALALRAIQLAGGEGSKLLGHGGPWVFATTRKMSLRTFTGDWVESIVCTSPGP